MSEAKTNQNTPQELWNHQREALTWSASQKKSIYGFDPGLGKTKTAIIQLVKWYKSHHRVLTTLIIVPNSIVEQWKEKIIEECPKLEDEVQTLTGTSNKRIKDLLNPFKRIFITNYETLDTKLNVNLQKYGFDVLVLDEIHKCKNPSGKRTKKIIKIADKTKYCLGLSGSLILNKPEDCWAPLRILNSPLMGKNFNAWRHRYFRNMNANAPALVTWPDYHPTSEGLALIQKALKTHVFPAKKEECLDLPPLISSTLSVEMLPSAKRIYKDMEKEFVSFLQGPGGQVEISFANLAVTKLLRLNQLLNGIFVTEKGDVREIDCPKYELLGEKLEEYLSVDRQIIIWTVFKNSYNRIVRVLDTLKTTYSMIIGGQSAEQRENEINQFKSGATRIVVANPAAAGTGVDGLQCAQNAIYLQRTHNLEHRQQSQARNYRGGSERHKTIHHDDIVVKGTVDVDILAALERKEGLQNLCNNIKTRGIQ